VAETIARVATAHGSRYLQQLCKHWAHKLDVTFTPEEGTVRFAEAVAVMRAEPEALVVTITAEDPAMLERMKGVVASHLDRFAFKEAPLGFDWS
jgi:hypothetical protein